MRFPVTFNRYISTIPAGGIALGGDSSLPAGAPNVSQDNVLSSRFANINGWPCHRIAVSYKGPSSAKNLPARMFIYEESTCGWYKVGSDVTLKPDTIQFFDVLALLDFHAPNGEPAGSIQAFLQIDAAGSDPTGTYTFAMAPDLTTF